MEVLQTSALPLGDGADQNCCAGDSIAGWLRLCAVSAYRNGGAIFARIRLRKFGAGNGIRTRDFDLGKVALYH